MRNPALLVTSVDLQTVEVGGDVTVVERVAIVEPQGWTLGSAQLSTKRLRHVHSC